MRVSVSKSKNAESFYIVKSFRTPEGKNTSKIVRKLGTLDELMTSLDTTDRNVIMEWAKQEAAKETEKEVREDKSAVFVSLSPDKKIGLSEKRYFKGGYLFLQDILYSMSYKNMIRNIEYRHKFEYDLEAILSDLIYARILEPGSKSSSYETAKSFLEPPKYKLHSVYRALSILAKESDYIQAEFYRNSNMVIQRNNKILYYDCTNYFFEVEEEDEFRKYGKSKEHRPNPIVQMGLFMDGDGIPLAFHVFPGNESEQPSMIDLEKKVIQDYKMSKLIVCTDAGLASQTNKRFNHTDDRGFIITQSIKKLKKADKEWALKDEEFMRVGDDLKIKSIRNIKEEDPEYMDHLYYKEEPYDIKGVEQTLIVTYSPKYAKYQRLIREKQVERAQKMIENGSVKRKRKNPNDPARFIDKHITDENGEIQEGAEDSYYLNESAIAEEAKYDGFYALTTDLFEDDIKDILEISERRWEIEESFRIMKTDFESRPVYVSREDRIKAHFLICYLALLVYRILEKKLGEKYTTEQICGALRSMNLLKIDEGYIPAFDRTTVTDAIHDTVDFRIDFEITKKSKMRNIIKNTKR